MEGDRCHCKNSNSECRQKPPTDFSAESAFPELGLIQGMTGCGFSGTPLMQLSTVELVNWRTMQSTVELSRCKPCQLSTDEKSASVAPADMRALLRSEVFGSKLKRVLCLSSVYISFWKTVIYSTWLQRRNATSWRCSVSWTFLFVCFLTRTDDISDVHERDATTYEVTVVSIVVNAPAHLSTWVGAVFKLAGFVSPDCVTSSQLGNVPMLGVRKHPEVQHVLRRYNETRNNCLHPESCIQNTQNASLEMWQIVSQ